MRVYPVRGSPSQSACVLQRKESVIPMAAINVASKRPGRRLYEYDCTADSQLQCACVYPVRGSPSQTACVLQRKESVIPMAAINVACQAAWSTPVRRTLNYYVKVASANAWLSSHAVTSSATCGWHPRSIRASKPRGVGRAGGFKPSMLTPSLESVFGLFFC